MPPNFTNSFAKVHFFIEKYKPYWCCVRICEMFCKKKSRKTTLLIIFYSNYLSSTSPIDPEELSVKVQLCVPFPVTLNEPPNVVKPILPEIS